MLTYTPGDTVVHRLDARTKLGFQFAFALLAFSTKTLLGLTGLLAVGVLSASLAETTVRAVLRSYWVVLLVLALGPVIAAISLGPPWIDTAAALASLRSVARVVPLLFVSAAYVTATPIRETRAAIQHTIPGRTGQLLGVGVALTFRFVPVVRGDLRRLQDAVRARGGDRRSIRERSQRLTTLLIVRALDRADRLSIALEARCFAWNPTLPRLRFSRIDLPVWLLSFGFLILSIDGMISV